MPRDIDIPEPTVSSPAPARRRHLLVPLIIATALFMDNLDSSAIATALPSIARALAEPPLALNLAMTTYLLALAAVIPASGWIADRFGARDVFSLAIAAFLLGSIGCGLSSSLPTFIIARAFQGVGAALMTPVGRLVLLRSVPKGELVAAMSTVTVPALIGPTIGPLVGGFITTYASWRWIFLINVPIGILGIYLARRHFSPERTPGLAPLDWQGLLLSGSGLAALVFGCEGLGRGFLAGFPAVAVFAAACLALGLYAIHARRVVSPALDLSLLSLPTFRSSVISGTLFRIGIGGLPLLLPFLFQLGFGMSPLESGSLTFTTALGSMIMKAAAPPILRRFGFRRVLIGNAMISGAFIIAYGLIRPGLPFSIVIALLLLGGFFRSLQFTGLNTLGYADLTPQQMSRGTSLAGAAQQLSLGLGVAVAALILQAFAGRSMATSIDPAHFAPAFLIVGLMACLSGLFFLRLPADAGHAVSGHRPRAIDALGKGRAKPAE